MARNPATTGTNAPSMANSLPTQSEIGRTNAAGGNRILANELKSHFFRNLATARQLFSLEPWSTPDIRH
jgi:hypothetical protein